MRPIDSTLIKVPLVNRTKQAAICELLDLLVAQGLVRDREKVLADLLASPCSAPSSMGDDAAVPHARSEFVEETVCAFGSTLDGGIDFGNGAPGEPCRSASLLFLMVSPARDTGPYVKALARIARLVRDEVRRNSLKTTSDPVQVVQLLGELSGA